ncbi:glycosyltransferase family 2 protein [Steroidobacter sp.]|uniref:glycosyltransferase family 2 protein n=1 Tax=Steroidobacter sp. TaxID=1978227 RepID=UPI001A489C8F|nr:glycosyltransferase family 2 protein [Steroidobacter sp.]MBL8268387.1 glycosyltransferase family 2 protein [Steroidobacter sp.]
MTSISVIVPTYNYGSYIAEAIASIAAQTLQPTEIIVIDDGSKDDTRAVIEALGQANLRYVYQNNAGVSAARNTALELATSDYIAFLDADDRWRPQMLEQQAALLDSDPDMVFCFTNFVRFDHATGNLLTDQFAYYPELAGLPLTPGPLPNTATIRADAFSSLIQFGELPAFTPAILFRRDKIAGMRFDTTLKVCEDTDFVMRTAMRGSVGFNREVLAEIRRHAKNATVDYSLISLDKLKALQIIGNSVTAEPHRRAHAERLVKAHIDAAVANCRAGRTLDGVRTYAKGLRIGGSPMRKLKGAVRVLQAATSSAKR